LLQIYDTYIILLSTGARRQILWASQNVWESIIMSLTALIFAMVLTQAAPGQTAPVDVAYSELESGDSAGAVHKLESNRTRRSDPALLINLGTAYAREGATDKAIAAFRAAIESPERYDLEMANGRWMDSREVARLALAALQRTVAKAQ
jgi:tetratricopeptide (TPR) repeat protein